MASSELSLLIECSVCLETKTNPRQLTCQHSYCSACLEALVVNRSIKCPTCRQTMRVPAGGVQSLPADFMANSLISAIDQLEVDAANSCGSCQMTPVKYYCKTCKEYLCDTCGNSTHKLSVFQDHRLVIVMKCQKHPKKDMLYACVDCQKIICSTCITEEHGHHSVEDAKNHIKAKQGLLQELVRNMNAEYSQKITEKMPNEDLQKLDTDIQERFALIKAQIDDAAAFNIQKIKQEQSKLQASLDVDRDFFRNWIVATKEARSLESKVEELKTSCDPYLNTTNPVGEEELERITDLMPQIRTLTEQIKETCLSPLSSVALPKSFSASNPEHGVGFVVYSSVSSGLTPGTRNPGVQRMRSLPSSPSQSEHSSPVEQKRDDHQIFVGDIPKTMLEADLKKFFGKYGKVVSVRIIPVKRQAENYGFVVFQDERTVRTVLSNCFDIELPSGHHLRVKENKHAGCKVEDKQYGGKKADVQMHPGSRIPEDRKQRVGSNAEDWWQRARNIVEDSRPNDGSRTENRRQRVRSNSYTRKGHGSRVKDRAPGGYSVPPLFDFPSF